MKDYLIIGAGLYGSIVANELKKSGKSVIVIDQRDHIGGNCFTQNIEGINVHKYGPHIFHTDNLEVWNYMRRLCDFNHFTYRPRVNYKGKIYSFPINLLTFQQVYGIHSPGEVQKLLERIRISNDDPKNMEEWILDKIGPDLYKIFIEGYTTKQWGKSPKDLPASIVKRIPIRLTFDDSYYNHQYQGIPIGGYTQIFEKLLDGIDVRLGHNYFENRDFFNSISNHIIYTGPIDKFYNYEFGKLEYRSLDFKTERLEIPDFQGVAGVNYTDAEVPYTRIVEHKHFEFGKQNHTIITKEYSKSSGDPYYPINDEKNQAIYEKYKLKSLVENRVVFGGRLAEYKYYDMHQIVAQALKLSSEIKDLDD
jgi:UDP-galactopyranose mutase